MTTLQVKIAGAALATLLSVAAAPARAEGFSTTNVQLLQGWGFHDNELGYDTQTGAMTTITLNHYSTWAYGDNFAFFDLYRGDFKNSGQAQSDLYAEWHPRLFLNQLLHTGSIGPIRNWGLAGEINQARGFYAYLGGLGLDLQIPGFTVAGLNVYYRYDNFNKSTFQISPFWTVPFSVGPVPFLFTGFVDVFLDANDDIDVMAQPELLVDVGALVGGAANRVHVGVEWYLHQYTFLGVKHTVSSPQAMVQWTVF
jgi:nucleoside-specific outer membrane channel protein Tsx